MMSAKDEGRRRVLTRACMHKHYKHYKHYKHLYDLEGQ